MARKQKEDCRNLLKRGKYWYVFFKRNGKRIIQTTEESDVTKARNFRDNLMAPFRAADKVEALKTLVARVTVAENDLAQVQAEQPSLSVDDVWQTYLTVPSRPDSGERTLKEYEIRWKAFVKWLREAHQDVKELRQVTSEMAEEYALNLSTKEYSPSTYNLHRNLLRLVWRVLGEKARCKSNPWDRITPRKLQAHTTRKHALTTVQFTALLDAAAQDHDLQDLFMVLAWTGQRLVDAVMLRWGEIDFQKSVITLTPRKTARRLGKQVHVPIFADLLPVLNRRQEAQGSVVRPAKFVFPELAREYDQNRCAMLSKRIAAMFVLAGMPTTEMRTGRKRGVCVYGAHSLRHHFVTAAASVGMPAGMIKSITGHATDGMLEHYQHMGAELAGEIAKKIGAGTRTGNMDSAIAVRPPLPDWAREAVRCVSVALEQKDIAAAQAALVPLLV
jgi:integrase